MVSYRNDAELSGKIQSQQPPYMQVCPNMPTAYIQVKARTHFASGMSNHHAMHSAKHRLPHTDWLTGLERTLKGGGSHMKMQTPG
jgi:hypothetical protein